MHRDRLRDEGQTHTQTQTNSQHACRCSAFRTRFHRLGCLRVVAVSISTAAEVCSPGLTAGPCPAWGLIAVIYLTHLHVKHLQLGACLPWSTPWWSSEGTIRNRAVVKCHHHHHHHHRDGLLLFYHRALSQTHCFCFVLFCSAVVLNI